MNRVMEWFEDNYANIVCIGAAGLYGLVTFGLATWSPALVGVAAAAFFLYGAMSE